MPNEFKITAAFVQQYHDAYELATTQRESRLLTTVQNRGKIEGESFTINDLGNVEMSAAAARFANTPDTIPDAGVRTALMSDFDLFIPMEMRDIPKLKANPNDKYMQLCLNARDRKIDDIIYKSLVGGITRAVVSDAGVKSTSTIALPNTQIILNAAGSIKQKIIKAKRFFRANECDEQNGEQLYMTYNAAMLEAILNDTTLTSADYVKLDMLQDGKVATNWLGFNWVAYEKMDNGAGGVNERRAVAYCKTAAHFGSADVVNFKINERPDKRNNMQVGGVHSFGAGRANENKVVAIDFAI